LLKHGADPNARDSQGLVPLNHAIHHRNKEFIQFLLEFGAEPRVSFLGLNPCILFRQLKFPEVIRVFEERTEKLCQQYRQEAKQAGNLKTCRVCHASHHCKRCAGCFLVWYCGAACQKADWISHKASCLLAQAQYRPVSIACVKASDNFSFEEACLKATGKVNAESSQPSKRHFIVKVQKLAESSSRLAINNKEMTISGLLVLARNPDLSPILKRQIETDGVYGNVAFFLAILDSTKLKINPWVVCPPEIW
jgi:hypothetical protein